MMKEKILLIAGCSHTSGSEINGTEDSVYNRQKSYGNQLAHKMGYRPINIAEPGSTNPTIARSVLQWFSEEYNQFNMEVFVLIGWTEVTRMECPWNRPSHYEMAAPFNDHFATSGKYFIRVNLGWEGTDPEEKILIKDYHRFMATNEKYLEIVSLNSVLQMQYFFDSKNVDYLMCNTLHMFSKQDIHTSFYLKQIDESKYYNMMDNEQSFFTKYKNLGYTNPKAKYWHHDETPHAMYADELYNFIEAQNVFYQMV
jgi:hypothetical protein